MIPEWLILTLAGLCAAVALGAAVSAFWSRKRAYNDYLRRRAERHRSFNDG